MEQHWTGYLKALGEAKIPKTSMPSVAPYETSSNEKATTGFFDLNVKNPKIQAQYDAMSGSWEGVAASDGAIAKGLFQTEAMPLNQKNYGKK